MKTRTGLAAIVVLGIAVLGLQTFEERAQTALAPQDAVADVLYVQSPSVMARASLSYRALVADLYWIRAVQYYGGTRLSNGEKKYDLLYPLLDLATSMDPHFDIAYRFGAIFLAEEYPGGAGRPDLAVALLQKGLREQPGKWQFAEDIGFVYYWWVHDFTTAADWFNRAGDMPGSAEWLKPLAAVTLAQGSNRESSRQLWREIRRTAEIDWFRRQADFRLRQLDAMDGIDVLERAVQAYRERAGVYPASWPDLIRAGLVRRIPADPTGVPFRLDASNGKVTLDPSSSLNPLPATEHRR